MGDDNHKDQIEYCAACGEEGTKLLQCAACKSVKYCSKECQVDHWKGGHKAECKELRARMAGGGLQRRYPAGAMPPQGMRQPPPGYDPVAGLINVSDENEHERVLQEMMMQKPDKGRRRSSGSARGRNHRRGVSSRSWGDLVTDPEAASLLLEALRARLHEALGLGPRAVDFVLYGAGLFLLMAVVYFIFV